MKKIILSSLMLLCMAAMFTACDDDNNSNPTLVQPSTFVLNEPQNKMVDLAYSGYIPMTWNQPDYGGWPAAVEYQMAVSLTGNYTVSTEQAEADKTGATVADYSMLPTIYKSCSGDIAATDLATALQKIAQWQMGEVPEKVTVYVVCYANTAGTQQVASNVVTFEVNPYYVELVPAPIELWYLVGSEIGSAAWDNGAGSVGSGGLVPMYPIAGNEYDMSTGQGEIQYAGYFNAGSQFKFVKVPGYWKDQLNFTNVSNPGAFLEDLDGDNHNIGIAEAGYYILRLNTATRTLVIEKYDKAVGVYSQIAMPGSYQEWDVTKNLMNPMSTMTENHDWYVKTLVLDADCTLKFAANGAWDYNWGALDFPYGLGTNGGKDIPVTAGTYNVYFNDILGAYNFVAQ